MADTPELPTATRAVHDPKGNCGCSGVRSRTTSGAALLMYRVSSTTPASARRLAWQDVIPHPPPRPGKALPVPVDLGMRRSARCSTPPPRSWRRWVKARERAQDKLHQRLGWIPASTAHVSEEGMLLGCTPTCSTARSRGDRGRRRTDLRHPLPRSRIML
jgi:hypothetical protein